MASMTVSIKDTELFKDIVVLLKELADKDPSVETKLAAIMEKYQK